MFNTLANFFETLNFNLKTGELSDVEAFFYYGLLFVIAYHFGFARKMDPKMYGMVLAGGGAVGIAINRYRKAAFSARVSILKQEGISKDAAYLSDSGLRRR